MRSNAATPSLDPADLGPLDISITPGREGTLYATSPFDLGEYDEKVTNWLEFWAERTPHQTFLAERNADGTWAHLTYADARTKVRALAQALLDRGLSAERPLVILSGNSIAHALIGLAALYVGIPYAPLSPPYSGGARSDFSKLRTALRLLTPGLVFAEDGARCVDAINAALPGDMPRVIGSGALPMWQAEDFARLLATPTTAAVEHAHDLVKSDTIAKLMFTSGSTDAPKAVVTTQRMLCANQTMIAHVLRFLRTEPPVLVDWLPWSHSFGGNQNFNLALCHGGTLYIDAGRPTPDGIATTLANLREIAPTLHFNVPRGLELLMPHLARDKALATNFFHRLQLTFFAGAPMTHAQRAALADIATTVRGERLLTMSGYGATETGPAALFWTPAIGGVGGIGLPLPGSALKLVPHGETFEVRIKGPHVTAGYWRDAALTAQAFDDEGYFRLGDALRFADARNPRRGFCFDGRIGENFKLASGTWVNADALRENFLAALAPYAKDVVIAGEGKAFVAALVFPDIAACAALADRLATDAAAADILAHPKVRAKFQDLLGAFADAASSRRIDRIRLLADPPRAGELTDKGTIIPAAVRRERAVLLAELFTATDRAQVIAAVPAAPTVVAATASACNA